MNWGLKIVIGMAAFMLFIIGASLYMVSQDSDSLIDEDYYEHSLSYDQVYNSKSNLIKDKARPTVVIRSDTLEIKFISSVNNGKLIFKRPSDGSLDTTIPFYTPTEYFKLPISTFKSGLWQLEITWTNNDKQYVYSQSLNF